MYWVAGGRSLGQFVGGGRVEPFVQRADHHSVVRVVRVPAGQRADRDADYVVAEVDPLDGPS